MGLEQDERLGRTITVETTRASSSSHGCGRHAAADSRRSVIVRLVFGLGVNIVIVGSATGDISIFIILAQLLLLFAVFS